MLKSCSRPLPFVQPWRGGVLRCLKHTDAFRFLWGFVTQDIGAGGREETKKYRLQRTLCILFIQLSMQVGITALYCVLIHMLGWQLVPEPCRGKVAASTGRHRWGISWVLRIQTGWKEAKLGVLEKSKTAVFIYICNINSWNGNAAEENMCTLHRRDVETSLCQVAAVVVGRGSEGHAGCQLNGSYVFTWEIKQLVLERNQCTQQYWDVKSWASFVVSYFYMFVCMRCPSAMMTVQKETHQCAVAAGEGIQAAQDTCQ